MSKVASKHFGDIELNHGREHCYVASHELAGNPLELDLNVTAHDHFDEKALHKVDYRLGYLPELVDQVRDMIAEELDQDGTNSQQFLHFHSNQLKEEQLEAVFGVREAAALAVGRVDEPAEAVPALVKFLKDEKEMGVKVAAARGLGQMGSAAKDAMPTLREVWSAARDAGKPQQRLAQATRDAMEQIQGGQKKN